MKKTIFILLSIFFVLSHAFIVGALEKGEKNISTQLTDDENYDFLIITPDILKEYFSPLKQHKESKEIQTNIIGLNGIYEERYFPVKGRDEPEQIKYFIKEAIEHWNTSYVMFVGGKEIMPVRYVTMYFNNYQADLYAGFFPAFNPSFIKSDGFVSDLYYADIYDENGSFCSWDSNNNQNFAEMNATTIIDEVDLYPDVCVGRILCSNASEAETFVKKVIAYENNAFNSDWFDTIILTGGDEHANIFIENLLGIGFQMPARTAWEGEYISKTVAQYLPRFTVKKYFASGSLKPGAEALTVENLQTAINTGAGFLLLSGHGTPTMIATHPPYTKQEWVPAPSGYTSSHVQNLRNNEKLPIAVLCACSTGNFDAVAQPLAWQLVNNPHGGAIASFAATVQANVQPSTLCTKTLLGHLTVGVFKTYAEQSDITGDIWKKTIENYLNDEEALFLGNPDIHIGPLIVKAAAVWGNHLNVEQWELFGDPSLKIGGYE